MMHMIGAVIFEGGIDSSPLDLQMREFRNILALDLLGKCTRNERIHQTVLVTNHDGLVGQAGMYPVQIFRTEQNEPFHFGRTLQEVCRWFGFHKVITFSGASVPLMTEAELEHIVEQLAKSENTVISNNPQSADVVAFSPVAVLEQVHLPNIDNPLPWILKEEGNLTPSLLQIGRAHV